MFQFQITAMTVISCSIGLLYIFYTLFEKKRENKCVYCFLISFLCYLLGEPGVPGADGKNGERGKTHCYQIFQFST